jgi:hypothetical protein
MKKLIIILLLYFPIQAYSQGWSVEYSLGYGSYQLDNIRSLQQSLLQNYKLKVTDGFPNYITHSVSLGYDTGRHHFGSVFSYLTTGGRVHRADYSGSYRIDMIMNGYRLGVFYRNYIPTGFAPLSIYLQASPGVLFSNLKINEQVNIYSESAQEDTKLKGVGIYLEPTIGAKYRFTNWLQFSLGGGYEFDFLGKMKLSGQETPIESNWSGVRLYGGLIFVLPAKINDHDE